MKLMNFDFEGRSFFGLAIDSFAVPFEFLQQGEMDSSSPFSSMAAYLDHLPESHELASSLQQKAAELIKAGDTNDLPELDRVKAGPILGQPTALIDFGLTPRHLVNSGKTMLKHEMGPIKGGIASALIGRRVKKMSHSDTPPYYKGNHLTVIGDHDEIGWPDYTSYLDIEPELGIVIGSSPDSIAGYTIFNDASARDVQFPEMIGTGPARSKDFANSNGLGPYLVTPDEVGDPLDLKVSVKVGSRHWPSGFTCRRGAGCICGSCGKCQSHQ